MKKDKILKELERLRTEMDEIIKHMDEKDNFFEEKLYKISTDIDILVNLYLKENGSKL